jgi:hypothetical protein
LRHHAAAAGLGLAETVVQRVGVVAGGIAEQTLFGFGGELGAARLGVAARIATDATILEIA